MDVKFLKSAFQESHYPPSDKPEIAFAGRSNVGKSSLINTLVNRRGIAKTSSRPGRTQAINFFEVNSRFYLVDLPGYGYARVPIKVKASWGEMVETYLRQRPNLKCVVVILDLRRDPTKGDKDLLEWLKQYEINAVVVLTKSDKLSKQKAASKAKLIREELAAVYSGNLMLFSAKTRVGRDEVWKKLNRLME